MLNSNNAKAAAAVLAVGATLAVLASVRYARKAAAPATVSVDVGAADGVAQEATRDPGPVVEPAVVPAVVPVVVPAVVAPPSAPNADKVVLFRDPRFDDLMTSGAPAARPPTVTPEVTTAAAAPAVPPRVFEDTRGVERDVREAPGSTSREATLTVPASAQAAPAPAPSLPFADPRGTIVPPKAQLAPPPETATARIEHGQAAVRAASPAAIAPRPEAAPTFTDQREFATSAVRAPATADRHETAARTAEGAAVKREGGGPDPRQPGPAFVDTRSPLGQAPPPASARAAPPVEPARVAAATPCGPAQIASEPLDGGRMLVRIGSPCRAVQTLRFSYGGATIEHALDSAGRLEITFDLFAGTASPVEIVFEDGVSREIPARANDLDRVEKVALIWRAPVDLDLHVYEYGAQFSQAGHIWSQAPSSAMSAREQADATRRGRGFLSRADNGGSTGDKVEVYTFIRHGEQTAGTVSIAVDNATRGDTAAGPSCGTGAQAEVRFETVVAARGRLTREAGVIAAVACGTQLSPEARYSIVHQIRVIR